MEVTYSNKVEKLFIALKYQLFNANTNPFTKRYVIVPSPAMKNWLNKTMAEDPDLRIATGIHITYIEPAVREIISKLSYEPEQFPKSISELELSLRLEIEMKKILLSFTKMTEESQAIWTPLVSYLLAVKSIPPVISIKNKESRRILALSTKLANLFITYGKYGSAMLRKWQRELSYEGEWQKELWKRCLNEVYPENFQWKKEGCTIHLFGLSFISKQHHDLFISLSNVSSVNYYVLSPCQMFWSEILSDKECRSLLKFWQKQGAQEAQQLALEEYIYDRNPLLANLGRVGREMALQVENSSCLTQEIYELPEKFKEIEAYRDLISDDFYFSNSKGRFSLLECLQSDLLLMRKPSANEKISFDADHSIQMHVSSSPMREVQTIYDILIGIIQKHVKDPDSIRPEDIIVMAPDIIQYEPFIHSVFGQEESRLDYQMMDLNILSRHPMVQGFLSLLSLSSSRWDVSSILRLFGNPIFQQRQGFTLDDIQKIKEWIEAADVRWGEDSAHRNEILKREFDEKGMMDNTSSGTWKKGIERLFLGMAMMPPDDEFKEEMPILPLNHVEPSQTLLFGKWIHLMRSLKDDLQPITEGSCFNLTEWSLYLKCLLEAYFIHPEQKDKFEEETSLLWNLIESLSLGGKWEKETFSFSTIYHHLENNLKKQRIGYRESHLHAVRFCSMLPMRALPAKVVVLLGMSEEGYPRRESNDSLNMLKKDSENDYCPSQSEFDRYLFLETILSARDYFVLSYSGYSKSDGKAQSSSLLVSELFSYLDQGFTINGTKPSEACFKKYPFLPYDKSLFVPGTQFQTYSSMYYKAALAFYGKTTPISPHCFIPTFAARETLQKEIPLYIDIKSLARMAKNPIEAYIRKLGMYLKEEEKKNDEEDFILDALKNGMLRKEALHHPFNTIIKRADKEGKLPIGPFRNFSIGKLSSEVNTIKQHSITFGIQAELPFEMHFSEHYDQPEKSKNGNWHLPPLECLFNGKTIKIIGKLINVTSKGLISTYKDDKSEILFVWPQYLIFLCAIQNYSLPIEDALLFIRYGKKKSSSFTDPLILLENYIAYYFYALQNISPLIPEWVPDLVLGDSIKFQEKIQSTLSDKNSYFYNNHFKWILRGSKYPEHEIILETWKPIAENLFGELYRCWYPSRKGNAL